MAHCLPIDLSGRREVGMMRGYVRETMIYTLFVAAAFAAFGLGAWISSLSMSL